MIDIDKVSVRFGGLWAVKDVGFAIEDGQITAVIGPNGAGKSTLFNVVTGFVNPVAGTVSFNGRVISGCSPEKIARFGIARTFQTPEICGDMTVLENVMLGAHKRIRGGIFSHMFGMPWTVRSDKQVRQLALECLEQVGLLELQAVEARALPLGRQRILEVARALAANPEAILLDEPASGLNDAEAEELRVLLKEIRNRNHTTIIFVEHNVRFVMALADRIAVLCNGELLAIGTPEEIRGNALVIEAYLGSQEAQAIC